MRVIGQRLDKGSLGAALDMDAGVWRLFDECDVRGVGADDDLVS